MTHVLLHGIRRGVVLLVIGAAVIMCSGCGTPRTITAATTSAVPNHAHDLVVLRGVPQVAVLATHTGLYRSTDGGATWASVGGEDGQAMAGLMFTSLVQSSSDVQRLYVLAVLRPDMPNAPHDPPGIYTSPDAGRTWGLATALSAFPAPIYTIATGTSGPGQLFAIVHALGNKGVFASTDGGLHWHALPPVPTATPSGIVGDPLHPQRLVLWSVDDGLFLSDDLGTTWQRSVGTQAGIFSVTLAGSMVYATSDTGLDVSQDGGMHLSAAAPGHLFDTIVASRATPQWAYALSNGSVSVTKDGGQTWKPTAAASWRANVIALDPTSPGTIFACITSPFGVEMSTDGGGTWYSVLS